MNDVPGLDDWESHWTNYADSASDNPAQRYRRRRIAAALGSAPVRLLDVGSGQGDLLADLAGLWPSAELAGVELSEAGIRHARGKVPQARFEQRDLLASLPPAGELTGWATHATCSEVLEHVPDPVALLRNARSYMAPGCHLVVTVPGGPMSAFDRHIGHRQHFKRSEIRAVLHEAGFRTDWVHATGFPVFNLYKALVIVRGDRLIADAAKPPTRAGSVAMQVFDVLFRAALPRSPFGWQLVASARL